MTNTLPSPEQDPMAAQQFTGSIEPVKVNLGHDTLEVPILSVKLKSGDSIVISSEQPDNPLMPEHFGQRALASFNLGGGFDPKSPDKEPYPGDQMDVLKVDFSSPKEIQQLAWHGEKRSPGYLLLVSRRDEAEGGYAFVDSGVPGMVGRQTNIEWFSEDGQPLGGHGPFADSVSRHQMDVWVSHDTKTIRFTGKSEKSSTFIKTRADQAHRDVIAENEASLTPDAAPKRSKARLVAGGVALAGVLTATSVIGAVAGRQRALNAERRAETGVTLVSQGETTSGTRLLRLDTDKPFADLTKFIKAVAKKFPKSADVDPRITVTGSVRGPDGEVRTAIVAFETGKEGKDKQASLTTKLRLGDASIAEKSIPQVGTIEGLDTHGFREKNPHTWEDIMEKFLNAEPAIYSGPGDVEMVAFTTNQDDENKTTLGRDKTVTNVA